MNAIEKTKGPCLIMAGAGTGKTQTIIEKIKYLVNNKIYSPERIVCITFSNEAANNLLSRVRREFDSEAQEEPIIKTFHAFSAYLLREYGDKIGVDKEFRILDPDAAKIMLHSSFKINPSYCHRYISAIGSAKDLGIEIKEYEKYLENKIKERAEDKIKRELENLQFELQTMHLRGKKEDKKLLLNKIGELTQIIEISKFVKIWNAYEKLKERKNSLDYSDLNLLAIKLLRNSKIFENFDYIIVDEFQDTNKVQIDLLNEIAKKGNLTVVGDLNQSIYGFRGAYKGNLDIFKKNFGVEKGDIYNLDLSYRSPNIVLRNAHLLISNNYRNKDDCFFVENAHEIEGEKIKVYEMQDGKEEMRKVVELIEEEMSRGVKIEEICVMFRTHQQSRLVKKMLEEKNIEYVSVGKDSLLKQNSIKLVINYMSLIKKLKKNESNKELWWEIFYNSGINGEDLRVIGNYLKKNEKENLNELILANDFNLNLSENGETLLRIIKERIKILSDFDIENIEDFIQEVYRVLGLVNSEYNNKNIIMNLNKFRELARTNGELYESTLEGFLYYLDIIDKLGIEIDAADIEEKGIRIMTSHSTKGLEFKVIILTNMAEKRFPLLRVSENILMPIELSPEFSNLKEDYYNYQIENQISEERRLCYVSFTRTKENLILTYANEYGGKKFINSRFLDEIKFKENSDIEYIQDKERKYVESDKNIEIKTSDKVLKDEGVYNKALSPSSLLTFLDCQKMFQYKYVFNMPEKKTFSWEAMQLGSFVHFVLERGVKSNFSSLKEFMDIAKELFIEDEWKNVDIEETIFLIRIFFERNKGKFNGKSLTEQCLNMKRGDFNFIGYADRIDFLDNGIEIVDYKTGKGAIYGKERDFQLGYYALAAAKLGKVKKVTLDMLKQEKPIEFEIDDKGNAVETINKRASFNIYDVEREIIETAREINKAYQNGFKACEIEKNCEFCNEYVYGL